VAVDVMYLKIRPVLHIVDEASHYQAATFLNNVSASETCRTIRKCWINTYLRPPDALRTDQGTNFMADHFRGAASAEGISLLRSPIECPTAMSHVERYHGPLRAAFDIIQM
jgi:transposase InsO family protein